MQNMVSISAIERMFGRRLDEAPSDPPIIVHSRRQVPSRMTMEVANNLCFVRNGKVAGHRSAAELATEASRAEVVEAYLSAGQPVPGVTERGIRLKGREITSGLAFPEGPIAFADGIVVEIEGGKLTRVLPSGKKEVIANLGGGPTGPPSARTASTTSATMADFPGTRMPAAHCGHRSRRAALLPARAAKLRAAFDHPLRPGGVPPVVSAKRLASGARAQAPSR